MTDTLTPQELGVLGENLAVQWLEDRHYTIVDRNVRIPGIRGELDIIAFDTETTELVFVEVKTRTTTIAGWPEEAITRKKHVRFVWLLQSGCHMHMKNHRRDSQIIEGFALMFFHY